MWVSCKEQYFHTPDEAMSGGLVKACVPRKKCSVREKLEFLIVNVLFLKSIMTIIEDILCSIKVEVHLYTIFSQHFESITNNEISPYLFGKFLSLDI